jgi:hypothetical protein
MKKKILFILLVPIIVISCILGYLFLTQSHDAVSAQLVINSGTVMVKHHGESWDVAQSGMLLYQSDSLKTGDNSSASIVLFKSSIIRLDSNTEVMIKELIRKAEETNVTIKQDVGRTWNTILNISGIDNYEVHTPTTVASIRATTFVITVQLDGGTFGGVGQGNVLVSKVQDGEVVDKINVQKDQAVVVVPDVISEPLDIVPFEKDTWVLDNEQMDKENMEMVKEDLLRRIDQYIPELKERYGVTDQELEVLLEGYIWGYYDLPPETPDWIREIIELS